MSDFRSPKEALANYFDELLAGEDSPPAPVHDYADPAVVQQQKLEKLLQSAREQILVAPVAIPAVHKEPVEIQEWDITPSPGAEPQPIAAASPALQTRLPENALHQYAAPQEGAVQENARQQTSPQQTSAQESNYTLDGLAWEANGLPPWAQKDFDVLLFKVSGLTLAVPLISLGQIQPLTDELTPLFGQADWFMGLLPTAAGKIRTVNTAMFVMPERYDPAFLTSAKYVISINGVPWGLAVDSVNQPITLRPGDVKWRSERSKRPWLAGTVKAHMCVLLDVPMIGQMLMDADRNSSSSPRTQGRVY